MGNAHEASAWIAGEGGTLMSRCSAEERRRLRRTLWPLQGGRCFWCGVTLLLEKLPGKRWRFATIDHLDEKDSPNRGRFTHLPSSKRPRRKVLSCAHCNNDRSRSPLEHRLLMADQATWMLERLARDAA